MYYIGIDYHKDTAAVCVQTASGVVKTEYETTSDREGMDAVIEAMGGKRFKVMGETSTYSIDLHNYLISRSIDSCLVDPRSLRLITRSDKKTDRHDAKVIATFLRLMDRGEIELSMSFVLDGERRDLRDICRYREHIGEQKGATLRKMKSHMRIHSQSLEDGYSDFGTIKGQRMLRESFGDDMVLMEMLDDYVYFLAKSERIDHVLSSAEYRTKEIGLLMSIPGIGRITAVQMMSMIVDIERFETADRMRSYFGMNTQVMNSGTKTQHGHVTKRGDPMMRNILGRVLNVYLAHCPCDTISVYHGSHKDAMGAKKVRMACMNKLLDVVFAVLKRGTPYVSRRRMEGGPTHVKAPGQYNSWDAERYGDASRRTAVDCFCTAGAFRKMRDGPSRRSALMSECSVTLRREIGYLFGPPGSHLPARATLFLCCFVSEGPWRKPDFPLRENRNENDRCDPRGARRRARGRLRPRHGAGRRRRQHPGDLAG